ncbi:GNAT family N-acetyltransferase [Demequina lignilytica]|uniref:GNAT family N-acetyltransferase n=1 Tax=Demequina lignilytica TaxID=3051663 RepID=A0AAW7M284_9MICO|nr:MULTISPECIES: GNAT family N-acetyltransferase [unclassified Demequina]MDN4477159.1 GNAT family N-acetyltransferase [Demequina sp. SYSU T00039-1]MDN4484007.1 GNAT family N-acetyltransferase [Demequina sp. SYSU T0a273]MDN4487332.1 GNAT family N-acetyltransferase [Demequina sp. SYSU T00039]MDN4491085.1 GNAT family N-acetyltransferase [Demequina sp. SYSU T00068]
MTWPVPARIATERLVLRRYAPADAEALAAVAARNREHLIRFLPWAADEPQSVAQRRAWIAEVDAAFDAGTEFTMGLFLADGTLVGGTGYHVRTEPEPYLEIGYWIDAAHEGLGLVTEAVAALTLVALEICGVPTVGIAHAPANTRSAAVPARLGYARQPDTAILTCSDGGAAVAPVEWRATPSTLAVEPLASWPRPALTDADGAAVAWPG